LPFAEEVFVRVSAAMIGGEFVHMASGAVTSVSKFKNVTCTDPKMIL